MLDQTPEIATNPITETVNDTGATAPEGLPPKFWDDTDNSVRIDAMIKSYSDLERRLGGQPDLLVPDNADDYNLVTSDLSMQADADVNARLHKAGFTQAQAKVVYQLAEEKLMPLLSDLAQDYEAEAQIEHLEKHFGGAEKWREISRQLKAWGQANLSTDVFDLLTSTRDGVLTLHRMMGSAEPGIGRGTETANGVAEGSIKELMNSPRYWRDRDPATVEKVRQGFKSLYPDR
ncbi:MAG TPA: hypothetical protein ENI69_11530 [Rhodospirillales bacterium]|nr:hypothetical protein [Rhodospirillales bacterium]